jgi:single-strand DNA-binding protein
MYGELDLFIIGYCVYHKFSAAVACLILRATRHCSVKEKTLYQQITLIGYVGTPPEMRYTSSGIAVADFSLAVNRRWINADGQTQEKTTWFRISTWKRQAEIVSQYVTKDSLIMVVGEVDEARPWTDRNGLQRVSIEITALEVRFLDGRNQDRDSSNGGNSLGKQEAPEAADIPF